MTVCKIPVSFRLRPPVPGAFRFAAGAFLGAFVLGAVFGFGGALGLGGGFGFGLGATTGVVDEEVLAWMRGERRVGCGEEEADVFEDAGFLRLSKASESDELDEWTLLEYPLTVLTGEPSGLLRRLMRDWSSSSSLIMISWASMQFWEGAIGAAGIMDAIGEVCIIGAIGIMGATGAI